MKQEAAALAHSSPLPGADRPVKVVYIAGAGRSGTTLLDVLLGELDGFFSGGEIRWLWWGLLHEWRCGCGVPVRDCPVWSSILEFTFEGQPDDATFERTMRDQQAAIRLHFLPRLLAARADRPSGWHALERCIDTADRLYRSIAYATGSRVIVDSSKNAAEAALLRLVPTVDPYLIQLTRDPRAVAHSMQRVVKMEPMTADRFEQPRHSPALSGLIWMRKNAAADLTRLRYPKPRARLVRYEDLVARPQQTLRGIAEWVGEPWSGLSFSGPRSVRLSGNHTAWGNPSRFETGSIDLRPDDEWRARLGRVDGLVPTALSLPLLLRYRYPLRRKATTTPAQ